MVVMVCYAIIQMLLSAGFAWFS